MWLLKTIAALCVICTVTSSAQQRCIFEKTRSITIEGGQYKPVRFGNTKKDFHLKGAFSAHGGKISVFITDSENYARMINGKKFETFYVAKKVTQGSFDVALALGNYHLVWWNESASDSVVIEAEVCFFYPEQ